jgi:predicted Zn-dependent peptidase
MATRSALHRLRLDNGLRVVLAPDPSAPVVAVSAHYDVGFRSEPEGSTGFAHLFEHLMFQGSESLEKLAHFRHVQSSGGTFNGSTHPDYTDYFEVLPSSALERALFLEADRMRAPRLTEENLRNQIDVVQEEIRTNVMSRPYGGFPWIRLPPVLYTTFPNAHNGYGDFTDLRGATLDDCAAFFDRYYAPANAVLTVAGDLDVDAATELVHRHFDDVPARARPERPSYAEPPPSGQRHKVETDELAPLPALALGWQLPDPNGDLPGYLDHALLSSLLTDGASSRIQHNVVHTAALATDVAAWCGIFGAPLDSRGPDTLMITAVHPADVDPAALRDALDHELESVATDGVPADELSRVAARWKAGLHHDHDRLATRTRALGALELLYDDAELLERLPDLVDEVTSDRLADAAKRLGPDNRAVLELRAGGAQA